MSDVIFPGDIYNNAKNMGYLQKDKKYCKEDKIMLLRRQKRWAIDK